jgi:hypothetical protein
VVTREPNVAGSTDHQPSRAGEGNSALDVNEFTVGTAFCRRKQSFTIAEYAAIVPVDTGFAPPNSINFGIDVNRSLVDHLPVINDLDVGQNCQRTWDRPNVRLTKSGNHGGLNSGRRGSE